MLIKNSPIDYLLGIMYPDLVIQNRLVFSPPLGSLQHLSRPIRLQLFAYIPDQPVSPEAFGQDVSIGTGRSVSKVLLAESGDHCYSEAEARKSLANSMLRDYATVDAIYSKYNVMNALYLLPQASLESVLRGMRGMLTSSGREWCVRLWQLQNVVDHTCEFDLRLEAFLLKAGFAELGNWIACVEVGLRLGREEREAWAEVYGEAGAFLKEIYMA